MRRKLFLQVWLPLLGVLLLGAAAARIPARSHALLVLLVLAALVTWMSARAAQFVDERVQRRTSRLQRLAAQWAAGDLQARLEAEPDTAEMARAWDAAANALNEKFRTLEESRRALEAVLDSMEEAVIVVDAKGHIQWTNHVMRRLAGGSVRLGSALVQTVRDPDLLTCVERALRERVPAQARARSVKPGRVFDVSAAPMPGDSAVAVLHDVTEIERVEVTRRDFIANVSHELRTPLTSISGYAETLMASEAQLPEQARDFLGIICRNAARMNRLTEDLLALARIESGEYKLRLQPVAASVLLDEAASLFTGSLRATDIRLEVQSRTEAHVLADMDAILQVFTNLLENAGKYGSAGRRIVMGARLSGDAVEFFVQDFGAGIASEHLDRIFERFYRVDKGRSKDSGGTGLGLAIAKHTVLAHGGSIRVESELNHGCTFLFTLPLAGALPPQPLRAAAAH